MNVTVEQRVRNELDEFRREGIYKRLNHLE